MGHTLVYKLIVVQLVQESMVFHESPNLIAFSQKSTAVPIVSWQNPFPILQSCLFKMHCNILPIISGHSEVDPSIQVFWITFCGCILVHFLSLPCMLHVPSHIVLFYLIILVVNLACLVGFIILYFYPWFSEFLSIGPAVLSTLLPTAGTWNAVCVIILYLNVFC